MSDTEDKKLKIELLVTDNNDASGKLNNLANALTRVVEQLKQLQNLTGGGGAGIVNITGAPSSGLGTGPRSVTGGSGGSGGINLGGVSSGSALTSGISGLANLMKTASQEASNSLKGMTEAMAHMVSLSSTHLDTLRSKLSDTIKLMMNAKSLGQPYDEHVSAIGDLSSQAAQTAANMKRGNLAIAKASPSWVTRNFSSLAIEDTMQRMAQNPLGTIGETIGMSAITAGLVGYGVKKSGDMLIAQEISAAQSQLFMPMWDQRNVIAGQEARGGGDFAAQIRRGGALSYAVGMSLAGTRGGIPNFGALAPPSGQGQITRGGWLWEMAKSTLPLGMAWNATKQGYYGDVLGIQDTASESYQMGTMKRLMGANSWTGSVGSAMTTIFNSAKFEMMKLQANQQMRLDPVRAQQEWFSNYLRKEDPLLGHDVTQFESEWGRYNAVAKGFGMGTYRQGVEQEAWATEHGYDVGEISGQFRGITGIAGRGVGIGPAKRAASLEWGGMYGAGNIMGGAMMYLGGRGAGSKYIEALAKFGGAGGIDAVAAGAIGQMGIGAFQSGDVISGGMGYMQSLAAGLGGLSSGEQMFRMAQQKMGSAEIGKVQAGFDPLQQGINALAANVAAGGKSVYARSALQSMSDATISDVLHGNMPSYLSNLGISKETVETYLHEQRKYHLSRYVVGTGMGSDKMDQYVMAARANGGDPVAYAMKNLAGLKGNAYNTALAAEIEQLGGFYAATGQTTYQAGRGRAEREIKQAMGGPGPKGGGIHGGLKKGDLGTMAAQAAGRAKREALANLGKPILESPPEYEWWTNPETGLYEEHEVKSAQYTTAEERMKAGLKTTTGRAAAQVAGGGGDIGITANNFSQAIIIMMEGMAEAMGKIDAARADQIGGLVQSAQPSGH